MNNPSQTKDMNELNNEIDDLINHLVIREGAGPNGSGGEMRYWKDGKDIPATQAIQALITEQVRLGRLRGVEEVLLRLKQAPPVDWLDAQTWVDSEYERLQAQLKDTHQGKNKL